MQESGHGWCCKCAEAYRRGARHPCVHHEDNVLQEVMLTNSRHKPSLWNPCRYHQLQGAA